MTTTMPKVVILCGGLGMRLREESEHKPKAMVEVGGRPILWHIMRHYERYGLNRFVLCLGYKGDDIRQYFLNYQYMNNDFTIALSRGKPAIEVHASADTQAENARGWEVTLGETGQKTMTGGRVKRIEKYIDSDYFLCTYGDGVSNVDLDALVAFHKQHGKLATVTAVAPFSKYGTIETDGNRITAFAEKPEMKESLISGGFFVFSREVFSYLSADESCVLEQLPFDALVRDGQMMTYRHKGYWQSMDTPRDVKQLNDEWNAGDPGWLR